MYYIGLALFIVILLLISGLSGAPTAFIDFPSLIVIFGISVPILMASGLFKDFMRGFKVMSSKDNLYTPVELKRTLVAINLASRALILSGIIGTFTGIVGMLVHIDKISMIGPSFAVAILTVIYALVFTGMIMPIKFRVEAVLSTFSSIEQ